MIANVGQYIGIPEMRLAIAVVKGKRALERRDRARYAAGPKNAAKCLIRRRMRAERTAALASLPVIYERSLAGCSCHQSTRLPRTRYEERHRNFKRSKLAPHH